MVMGRGERSLLSSPVSELCLGRRRRKKRCEDNTLKMG